LANQIAGNLSQVTRKREILVLDFGGPEELSLPFSVWLADQFSVALKRAGQPLKIIPRSQLPAAIRVRGLVATDTFDDKTAEGLAKSLGGEGIVSAGFVALGGGLSVGVIYHTNSRDSWVSRLTPFTRWMASSPPRKPESSIRPVSAALLLIFLPQQASEE
jgi:hypothetical protein